MSAVISTEQCSRREGLLLGNSRNVNHANDRDILGLLDARQFVLLREHFIQGFLDPHATIDVGVGNCKPWNLPKGGIVCHGSISVAAEFGLPDLSFASGADVPLIISS